MPYFSLDLRAALRGDGLSKVEIHAAPARPDAATVVTRFLRGAAGDVARGEVAEARILAFEVVVTRGFGNFAGILARVARALRHPYATIVAEAFAHQRELRLVIARDGNARRVNLRVARVGERGSALVRAVRRRDVAADGVRGKEVHVAVAASGEHHRVGRVRFDLAGYEVPRDDAACLAVDHHEVEHFAARHHLHAAAGDLP